MSVKARHAGCCQTCDCIQVGQRRSLQGGLIAQLRNSDIANAINQNKGHKLWRLHHVWGSGWAPQGAVVGKSTSWRGRRRRSGREGPTGCGTLALLDVANANKAEFLAETQGERSWRLQVNGDGGVVRSS